MKKLDGEMLEKIIFELYDFYGDFDHDFDDFADLVFPKMEELVEQYSTKKSADNIYIYLKKELNKYFLNLNKDKYYFDVSIEDYDAVKVNFEDIDDYDCMSFFDKADEYKLLTREEEIELAKAIENGDESKKEKFVLSNMRLVYSIALKYKNVINSLKVSDLVQEGTIGLMRAIDKFDYTLGFKFSTYATWWIRQSIVRAIYNSGDVIRIPVHTKEKITKFNRAFRELEQELRRQPTAEEIANRLNVSIEEVEKIMLYTFQNILISLDGKIYKDDDDDDKAVINVLKGTSFIPDKAANTVALHELLTSILDDRTFLDEREAFVLRNRMGFFGEEKTLQEIGDKLGITRERVRQLESMALRRLRNKYGSVLSEYLKDIGNYYDYKELNETSFEEEEEEMEKETKKLRKAK